MRYSLQLANLANLESRPSSQTGTVLTNFYDEYEIDVEEEEEEEEEEEAYNLPMRVVSNSGLRDASKAKFDRSSSVHHSQDLQSIHFFFSVYLFTFFFKFPSC